MIEHGKQKKQFNMCEQQHPTRKKQKVTPFI